jgi:putative ABC transport system permease protein
VFALLVLAAAAFVAFNFTHRLVQTQRREIGIGMALGVPPARLARRPLLVAGELAVLGVLVGIVAGIVMSAAMSSVLRQFTPLPSWQFPFQLGLYAQGAALALVVPVAAALIPVWRAVRVAPVDAIRPPVIPTAAVRGHTWLRRLPVPRRTTRRIPVRDLTRAPLRTVMTAAGIATAITVLVGLVGLVDSFYATADRAEAEASRSGATQMDVELDGFYPHDSPTVQAIVRSRLLGHVEVALQAGGALRRGATSFPVLLEVRDLKRSTSIPTIENRATVRPPGIVLTDPASRQLHAQPGGTVTVRYPQREGPTSYRFAESKLRVLGTTPFPVRGVAYVDRGTAALARAEGLTNLLVVTPARGVSVGTVQRALFHQPGVVSTRTVVATVRTVREQLDRVLGALVVVEAAVLFLALLIAYSAARIHAEERSREDATMLAFGLPVRSVVQMSVVGGLLIGCIGTALGLAGGVLLLGWLVHSLLPQTLPEIGIVEHLAVTTVLIALALGIAAVAAAPLPNAKRLARLNLPAALRVVE